MPKYGQKWPKLGQKWLKFDLHTKNGHFLFYLYKNDPLSIKMAFSRPPYKKSTPWGN